MAKCPKVTLLVSGVMLCAVGPLVASVLMVGGDANDQAWRSTGASVYVAQKTARIGTETAGQTTGYVIPFLLPEIPAGEVVTDVVLTIYSEAQSNLKLSEPANLDVRGVRAAATSITQATDLANGTLVADNAYAINSSIPVAQTLAIDTDKLRDWIIGIYSSDPAAAGKYVFLTIFPDAPNSSGSHFVTVSTADSATASQRPTLTITTEVAAVVGEAVTHNGVTWQLLGTGHTQGTFVNGDPWVVGPVTITSITNSLNSPLYTPRKGQNGSMVNPLVGHDRSLHGYDDGLTSYREALNAGLPKGQPVSASNPLVVPVGSTLISMVSWLYNSETDAEPGCPSFNGATHAPRPVTRSAGVLTVLDAAPPANAFRPPYAGQDKTVRFTLADIDRSKLLNLAPTANTPDPAALALAISKTWIDHGYEYLGAMFHPSEHMPNYGRDMAQLTLQASLILNLDFSKLSGNPSKDPILIPSVQFGIDTCGVADAGGGFPANGGHHMGRFWPVLFAGLMLDDSHMKAVGTWGKHRGSRFTSQDVGLTEFQEIQTHFYVSTAEVSMTHSAAWDPDTRATLIRYENADIGTPDWGIRHTSSPESDNASMDATYRDINGACTPGFVLAARLMGAQRLWNHDAYFDYADRYMAFNGGVDGVNDLPIFARKMWQSYAAAYDVVSYNDFLLANFTPAEIADPLVAGRTADPDGDGNTNAEEYYFGTQPRTANPRPPLIPRQDNLLFKVGHRSAVRPPNGSVVWERSLNLTDWLPVEPASLEYSDGEGGGYFIEAAFSVSGQPRAFYRVRAGD